jgi:uridine kinase
MLSLDDYYVDRSKAPHDPAGERDFEAFEAMDAALLLDHVSRLLAGESVRTARYDFVRGESNRAGREPIRLGEGDVLLIEGIHGLNPRLLAGAVARDARFGVFIHPATTLSFDRLSRVTSEDIRLLRRIVRDRRHRGATAEETIARWPSVRRGDEVHIYPHRAEADEVFDSSLVYEISVLKVYAERYLLEVGEKHPSYPTAHRPAPHRPLRRGLSGPRPADFDRARVHRRQRLRILTGHVTRARFRARLLVGPAPRRAPRASVDSAPRSCAASL